jgi:hypothetical protein
MGVSLPNSSFWVSSGILTMTSSILMSIRIQNSVRCWSQRTSNEVQNEIRTGIGSSDLGLPDAGVLGVGVDLVAHGVQGCACEGRRTRNSEKMTWASCKEVHSRRKDAR